MELSDALGRISEIRAQVAQTETFRGFRSVTVGFSGALGIAAAFVQRDLVPLPVADVRPFVNLWVGVAAVSLLVVSAEFIYRLSVEDSPLKRRLTLLAVQQFAPCLIAGAAMTFVIAAAAPDAAWMLPGLWALMFSLGVFACCRLLPRATFWVGIHYLVAGTLCLALGPAMQTHAHWMMIGTFGIGQLLAAAILYCTLERRHEPTAG